jgi:hypothetical protein
MALEERFIIHPEIGKKRHLVQDMLIYEIK